MSDFLFAVGVWAAVGSVLFFVRMVVSNDKETEHRANVSALLCIIIFILAMK